MKRLIVWTVILLGTTVVGIAKDKDKDKDKKKPTPVAMAEGPAFELPCFLLAAGVLGFVQSRRLQLKTN